MENKDTNYRVGVGITPASETELVSRIKAKALELAAEANHLMPYTRKVSTQAVFTVVDRSLYANRVFSHSVKEHVALKDVSEFIALAQKNKVVNFSVLDHTDLLPIAHPRSTQEHDMHPLSLEREKVKWFTSIDGLTNEIQGLIASAMTSDLNSTEYIYATTRLNSLQEGSLPAEAMFGWRDGIFSGGNSRIARSLRARIQNRDSDGQFAEMFGAAMAWVRDRNGQGFRKLTGRIVGGDDEGNMYIETEPGKVTQVPTNKTSNAGKAYIFSKDKQEITSANLKPDQAYAEENDLQSFDAAPGWERDPNYNGPGQRWTDGAYNVVKFDNPSPVTRDRIDKAIQSSRERDREDPQQIKLGEDGLWDPDYPLMEISRKEGRTIPFGYAQSWGDIQLLARNDDDANDEYTVLTSQDISDYEYPSGYYRLRKNVGYDPKGVTSGKSQKYTDDPVALSNMFDEEKLKTLLRDAVSPEQGGDRRATGFAEAIFDPENPDVIDQLPAEAIYKALDQKTGGKANEELAKIYDEGLGSSVNTDNLKASQTAKPATPSEETKTAKPRAKKKKSETKPAPSQEPVSEEVTPSEDYVPPLLRGLTDEELANFKETGEYRNFLPKNEEFEIPDGYSSLDPDPVDESEINKITTPEQAEVFPVGWDDSPINIAKNYSPEDLKQQLERAVSPDNENAGQGLIALPTDDGEKFTGAVSAEKIRDALQLQGEDTNEFLDGIYKAGAQNQAEAERAEETTPAAKEKPEQTPETEIPAGEDGGGEPPVEKPTPSEEGPQGPKPIYLPTMDLKKGDVTYEFREYETGELDANGKPVKARFISFFTLDEDPDPENFINVEGSEGTLRKISVKGHFPGGPTQEKFWTDFRDITAVRGIPEDQLPPIGDLPELHVPKPKDEKYGDEGYKHPDYLPDRAEYQKKMAERSDLWSPPEGLDLEGSVPERVISPNSKTPIKKPFKPMAPRKSPFLSAFTDKAREIEKIKATTKNGKIARWEEFKAFFDTKEVVYFDTETTGLGEDDRVFQISITKAVGRDRKENLTLWINPEKSLNQEVVEKLGQRDSEGNLLTDEWLQNNGISYEEAGRQISEFIGNDATLAAYNAPFDEPHLRKLYEAAGADFDSSVAEIFDVLAFADKAQLRDKSQAYRPEKFDSSLGVMVRPRALKLVEQAKHFGYSHENAHDAQADVDATIHVANSVLDRVVETGQNANLFEIDAQQAIYDKEMATYTDQALPRYEADLKAYNDALEADKKDPVTTEEADPDGPSTTAGDNPETNEITPNVVDPESNPDRPVGPLSDMDPEWINDDANTTSMDLTAEDLQPGDYVTVSGRQQRVDAIRIGASYGVEDGVARVTFTDVESGKQRTGNLPRTKPFTGVRRPNDPRSVQANPEATKERSDQPLSPKSQVTDLNDRPVSGTEFEKIPTRQKFTLGDNTGVIEITPTQDGGFYATGTIYDADGNALFKTEGTYFSYEGASKEMELATRRGFLDQTQADRTDQLEFDFNNASDDVEVAKGEEPAYDTEHQEVFDTQYGAGKIVVSKLVDKTGRNWYVMDASGFDGEGEFIDGTQEVFSNKEEAIAYGRRWLANSSNVKKNEIDAQKQPESVENVEDVEPNLTPESEKDTVVDVDGTETPSYVPFWESKRRQRGKHRRPKERRPVIEYNSEKEPSKKYFPRPESVTPEKGKGAYLVSVLPEELQPGDVLYPEGFVLLRVEKSGNNIIYTGHYPNGRNQNLVEYNAANKPVRVIRNLNKKDMPSTGDNPPIIRPNPRDYPGGRQNFNYQIDRKEYLDSMRNLGKEWSAPSNLDEYIYALDIKSLPRQFAYGFLMHYGKFNDKEKAEVSRAFKKLIKINGDRLSEIGLPRDYTDTVPGIPVYDTNVKNYDVNASSPDDNSTKDGEAFLAVMMPENDAEAFRVFAEDYWNTNMVLPNGQPVGPMPASFPEELRRQLGRPEFTERPQQGAVLRPRDGVSTWVNPDGTTAPFNPEDPTQGTDETNGRIYGSSEFAGPEKTETQEEETVEPQQGPSAPPVAEPKPEQPEIQEAPAPTPTPTTSEVPEQTEEQKREFAERRRVINETTTREQNNHINRSADGVEVLEVGDLVYHYSKITDGFPVYGVVTNVDKKAYGNKVVSTTGEVLDYTGTEFEGYVEVTYFGPNGQPLKRETVSRKTGEPVLVDSVFKRASRNHFVVQKFDGRVPENSPLATGESIEDLRKAPASPANRDGFRNPRTTPKPNQKPTPSPAPKIETTSSGGSSWGLPTNVSNDLGPGVTGWEDVNWSGSKQSDIPNHKDFESIVAGSVQGGYDYSIPENEKLSGVDQVKTYTQEILNKYGFSNRPITVIAGGKKLSNAGAAAAVGTTRPSGSLIPHPAMFIFARKKYNKAIILHEIAHLMEGGFKSPDRDRGHSQSWYETYLTLLRGEGLGDLADKLEKSTGRPATGTGVLTRVERQEPVKTDFTPEEVKDFQSETNKKSYSIQEAIDITGANPTAIDKVNSLVNGTEEDPYAFFETIDPNLSTAKVSDIGVPVKSLYTDMPLSPTSLSVTELKDKYLNGDSVDPILVVERDGKFYIADGLDRAQAAYGLGLENIPAMVIPSDKSTPAFSDSKFYSFSEIPDSTSSDYIGLAIQAKKSEDAREKVVSSILEALEAGVVPWQKPWSSGGMIPFNGKTNKQYSALNTLNLWLSGTRGERGERAELENIVGKPFTSNVWLGYNQAKELGGQVKAGSKGTSVLYPVIKEIEVKDPNTGEVKKEKKLIGYGETNVFNLDQIDGLDNLRPVEKDPVPVSEAEAALIEAYKNAPPVKNAPQDEAYYSPIEDAIYLPNRSQFDSPVGYFETLAHEFVHSTGHEKRLDRTDLTANYGSHRASRAEEELIAEIGTAILASMLGVDLDINQPASYVNSWLQALQDDRSMIIKAASAAQKAADYILEGANLGAYGKSGEEIAEQAKEER